jgi:hypothetical protein
MCEYTTEWDEEREEMCAIALSGVMIRERGER